MTATTRSFQFSPTGAYVNPAVITDSSADFNISAETFQPRRLSLLPDFLRKLGPKISVAWNGSDSNVDVVPSPDFYRKDDTIHKRLHRPDLDDLHQPYSLRVQKLETDSFRDEISLQRNESAVSNKLGWIDGVYIRTMMNLFGVMLFLRMGWMAGQAGVILALVQIAIGTLVTTITTLSMIALCTNGNIGGGGIYSMISRSVGHEAGGVIGFMFTFTNAAFVGLNLLGTAESVSDILNAFDIGIVAVPSGVNDQRIIGYICLVIIALIPLISLEFEAKTMLFFFLMLVISLIDYFIGAIIPPSEAQKGKGFAYWESYVIIPNLFPRWDGVNFFGVFGVFFPSVTGIFTGASMSADLKDPAKAIPLGTFLAIATTSIVYAIIVIFLGFTVVAYATGNPADIIFNNKTCEIGSCPYGLINDYQTMSMSGALSHTGIRIEPLIYAGIFSATLSSALGCYTAAPRIFQAFCDDQLIPIITWFGKGYGPAKDPRHGYIVTFIIAAIFVSIGDVNTAGVWISNFYLGAFFMVNFSLWHVAWVNSLSFRPSFIYYNKWISLLCGIFCIVLMFLFDVVSAAVVCGLTLIIYFTMLLVDPTKANWGPSTEEQCFNCARCITFRLDAQEDHVKHYRPMILLMCGNPKSRQSLVDMANLITKRYGLLFLSHIIKNPFPHKFRENLIESQKLWLNSEKIKAFYRPIDSESLNTGVKSLLQTTGLGKFSPNIVMLGYKNNWSNCNKSDLFDYFEMIHSVLDNHYALILFRVQEGHDFSSYFDNYRVNNFNEKQDTNLNQSVYSVSKIVENEEYSPSFTTNDDTRTQSPLSSLSNKLLHNVDSVHQLAPPSNIYEIANRFKYKQKKGNIDVWWIYDDGGLTVLISYILKNNKLWKGCKLRVFTVTTDSSQIDSVQFNLTQLLQKFRIPFFDVFVLSSTDRPPIDETKNQFVAIISKWLVDVEEQNKNQLTMDISQADLIRNMEQTNKYLRIREHLLQYSSASTLILMTLPVPRKEQYSVTLYMSWLEILTHNMPPFLLIRGNQTSVLTFYC